MSEAHAMALRYLHHIVAEHYLWSSTLSNSVQNASNVVREVFSGRTRDRVEAVGSWKVLELTVWKTGIGAYRALG